jgi:hypothetical protein
MSILVDCFMIFGSYYLQSWPALAFFAFPLIPKIIFQIGFWLSPVLWQPIIPYHKLIQNLLDHLGLDIVDGDLVITEGNYRIVVRDKDGNLQVIENDQTIIDHGKLVQ